MGEISRSSFWYNTRDGLFTMPCLIIIYWHFWCHKTNLISQTDSLCYDTYSHMLQAFCFMVLVIIQPRLCHEATTICYNTFLSFHISTSWEHDDVYLQGCWDLMLELCEQIPSKTHLANRIVHSEASSSCLALSAKYKWAMLGTSGLSAQRWKSVTDHMELVLYECDVRKYILF